MKIQKILFVVSKFHGGGAERVASVLCSSLAEMGYDVTVILYDRVDGEYPISPKVKTLLLPARNEGQGKLAYYLNKFAVLRKMIRQTAPDVLIPFLPYQVEHSFIASRGLKIPFVVTVRNNPLFDTPSEKMRRRRDWIARHSDVVFLQNHEQLDYFPRAIRDKSIIVPNPVNHTILDVEYVPSGDIKKIVTMGRLSDQKNHKMLIRAFAEVQKNHKDLTLDIYGAGELETQLRNQIRELGLEDAVRLCGRTDDVANTYAKYDLFIMSSDFEGMPNALMEAMGVGLPCISTDCPTGPSELLGDNERGLLVATGDTNALISSMEYAIANPEAIQAKAKQGKEYVRSRFAPEQIAKLLISELENIIYR